MMDSEERPVRPKRADARRNEETLLNAAAAVFVTSGVDAPVREVAAKAGVGMGTIYRHFPTRADLIVAVYRHQIEALADSGPALLAEHDSPSAALVAFLVTKHGLASALQEDQAQFETLHTYFLERLVPACAALLEASVDAGEIRADIGAYELLRGVGNLCLFAGQDPRYDPRRLTKLLLAGLLAAPGP